MSDIAKAYNKAAKEYRKRYDSIPPRIEDIDLAFSFIQNDNPRVLEIGCAYGREAGYILTKTNQYTGIDISDEYINMAKTEVSNGEFVCVDVLQYEFSTEVDIVFAFASLLHNSKEDVKIILNKVAEALLPGGVVFLSLKRRQEYKTEVVTDDLVSRQFYYYTRQSILDLKPESLDEVFYDEQERAEPWFTMILQKK